MYYKKSVKTAV